MTRISRPYILVWTIVGLFLTIGANFVPAYTINSPAQWLSQGVTAYPLGFKCQVGAVLLVSCLGGRTAGALAQVVYLFIGLVWLKIFNDGGGIEYIQKPAFGYLLAFIPGAWICGHERDESETYYVLPRKLRIPFLSTIRNGKGCF